MIGSGFWGRFRRASLVATAWAVLAFLVVPIAIVLPVSLTDRSYLSLPKDHFSTQYYAAFFSDPAWLASTIQSIVIATGATVVALFLGGTCAVGCWLMRNRLAAVIRMAALGPLIIPAIVQAIGLYRLWAALGLYDTYAGIILAHAILGLPYVVITVSASLSTVDRRLEQAARSLGASMWQTMRLVIAPAIMPGLLSGGMFAFASSFDELIVALFLTSRAIYTLPKRIWEGLQDDIDPTVAAAAMLLIALTLVLFLIGLAVRRLRARAGRRPPEAAAAATSSAPAKPQNATRVPA